MILSHYFSVSICQLFHFGVVVIVALSAERRRADRIYPTDKGTEMQSCYFRDAISIYLMNVMYICLKIKQNSFLSLSRYIYIFSIILIMRPDIIFFGSISLYSYIFYFHFHLFDYINKLSYV